MNLDSASLCSPPTLQLGLWFKALNSIMVTTGVLGVYVLENAIRYFKPYIVI